jgi:hypothetical protein
MCTVCRLLPLALSLLMLGFSFYHTWRHEPFEAAAAFFISCVMVKVAGESSNGEAGP